MSDTANAVADTATFVSDPLQAIYDGLRDGAVGLARDWLPFLNEALLPDLTAEWWVSAYGISFALAVIASAFIIIPVYVRASQGKVPGREAVEATVKYLPMFMLGAMYGPPMGRVLITITGSLTDQFGEAMFGLTLAELGTNLGENLDSVQEATLPGGLMIGIIVMLAMLVSLLVVVAAFIVQLLTLYFFGLLAPLAYMWLINERYRHIAAMFTWSWCALLAMRPALMFFLMVAYNFVGDSLTAPTEALNGVVEGTEDVPEPAETLRMAVALIASAVAMLLAVFAPLLFPKLAKILPGVGSSAGGMPAPATIGHHTPHKYTPREAPHTGSPSTAPPRTTPAPAPNVAPAATPGAVGAPSTVAAPAAAKAAAAPAAGTAAKTAAASSAATGVGVGVAAAVAGAQALSEVAKKTSQATRDVANQVVDVEDQPIGKETT